MKNKGSPRIEFTALFNKQRKVAPLAIKIAFVETLELFREDKNHPHLRNHALKRKFEGYKSIDVAEDWRAIFKETQTTVTFHLLGTHEILYRSKK